SRLTRTWRRTRNKWFSRARSCGAACHDETPKRFFDRDTPCLHIRGHSRVRPGFFSIPLRSRPLSLLPMTTPGWRRWSVNGRALRIQEQERRHAHFDPDVLLLACTAHAQDRVAARFQLPHQIDGLLQVCGHVAAHSEEDVVLLEPGLLCRAVLDG